MATNSWDNTLGATVGGFGLDPAAFQPTSAVPIQITSNGNPVNCLPSTGTLYPYYYPTVSPSLEEIRRVVRDEIRKALSAPTNQELKRDLLEIAEKL